jgi:hypothetical protein
VGAGGSAKLGREVTTPTKLNEFSHWLVAEEGHYLFAEKFQRRYGLFLRHQAPIGQHQVPDSGVAHLG